MRHKRIPRLRTPSEYQALGRAVRELRVCRELSQEALGYRCHMHHNYVGAIERGEANPRFECILRLIAGLDTTLVSGSLRRSTATTGPMSTSDKREENWCR